MKLLQEKIVIKETNGISFTREELPDLVSLAEAFKKLVNAPTPYGEGEAFPASLERFATDIITSLKGSDKVCEELLEWKTIPGLSGTYEISNVGGFVRRQLKTKGIYKNVKHHLSAKGVPYVYPSSKGKVSYFGVGLLVARTFVPNPESYANVLPKDGDAKNVDASNLIWAN